LELAHRALTIAFKVEKLRSLPKNYSDLNSAATRRLGLMLAEMLRPPVRGAASHEGAATGACVAS
jgi:hypothetical protein